uniref:Uncharacterized protein n=1 Tax=Aegilops tauschii subsp. strangulata TaxID=200361 RepID=A0A453AFT0_AEGTS
IGHFPPFRSARAFPRPHLLLPLPPKRAEKIRRIEPRVSPPSPPMKG